MKFLAKLYFSENIYGDSKEKNQTLFHLLVYVIIRHRLEFYNIVGRDESNRVLLDYY